MQYYQGKFTPKNLNKYIGDSSNIFARSGWEFRVFKWLDENTDVLEWASESVVVPYVCVTDSMQKTHRYFPDLYVKFRNKSIYLIEIKPLKETREPRVRKKATKSYIREVYTYGKNISKWIAAEKYAKERGWIFAIWTEKELKKIGINVEV